MITPYVRPTALLLSLLSLSQYLKLRDGLPDPK